ncbi:hypothetical protein JTB14_010130 [Gonioctena quinquepunctata]|nr:hypothetical protein JTB14_010130 [Gonioctena quinquepunctata]
MIYHPEPKRTTNPRSPGSTATRAASEIEGTTTCCWSDGLRKRGGTLREIEQLDIPRIRVGMDPAGGSPKKGGQYSSTGARRRVGTTGKSCWSGFLTWSWRIIMNYPFEKDTTNDQSSQKVFLAQVSFSRVLILKYEQKTQ